jgi:predicted small secreted protein
MTTARALNGSRMHVRPARNRNFRAARRVKGKVVQAKGIAMTFKTTLLLGLIALSTALSACNTTAGAGKDIKSAGNAIERSAEDAKR